MIFFFGSFCRELLDGMSTPLLDTVQAHPEWILEGKTAQVLEEVLLHAKGIIPW